MSKIVNSTSENAIVITPKAFAIEKIILTANNGKEYDLSGTVHDIKIHEGLHRSGLFVEIFIEDAANLPDELRIAFNERIDLSIVREEHSGEKRFDLELYVSGISNYSEPTPSSKAYTLTCISKHGYLNNKKLLNQPFDNTTAKLIKSIIETHLDSKVDVRCSTEKSITGIYPNLQPMEAIAWLLRNSFDNGTPVYLYETADEGLILTSYNEILKQDVYHKYNRNPFFTETLHNNTEKGIFEEERAKIRKVISNTNISKFEAAAKGAFGSVMNKIDIATKEVKPIVEFKYNELLHKLNDLPVVEDTMKIGKEKIEDFKNFKQHWVSENSLSFGDKKFNYHNPIGAKQLLKRNAHINNLNTNVLTLSLPGDLKFAPGKIIELEILRQADIQEEMEEGRDYIDEEISGKYLVSSVIHHFSKDGYFMQTNIKKDSFIVKQVREND